MHEATLANVFRQQLVEVSGQADVLTMGLPYIGPYNVNSTMNPILVACLGLGYFFNLYLGKPLVREGGVVIISHPTPWEFNPVHHPSYIDFFEQVLAETTDMFEIEAKYEESFATDPWYVHLYRTSYAYHGVHPLYMWYWCAHALRAPRPCDRGRGRPGGSAPAGLLPRLDARRRPRACRGRRRQGPDHHAPPRAPLADGGCHVTRHVRGAAAGCGGTAFRGGEPDAARWRRSRPCRRHNLGVDYDTAWARRYPVRLARAIVLDDITRPVARVALSPRVIGLEHLEPVARPDDPRR